MSYVTLTNITVLDNPTMFTNPFQFEVTFECIQELDDDLEWKITYVGSAESDSHDQILEEVLVGPVPLGTNKFVFQANPPNLTLIPDSDKVGVTVVLVTCSYKEHEFVRVGYYVNNDYVNPENPNEGLMRNILADKPRVTRFPIQWGNVIPTTNEQENQMTDGNAMEVVSETIEKSDMLTDLNFEDDDVLMLDEELEEDEDEMEEDEEDLDCEIDLENEMEL